MEFNLSWILLGAPALFVLGWFASRFDLRQIRLENRQAPKAYFKGLNYLLNEQQDEAIDAFIEAVQNDPDTSELHFALGNLFRRRGEYQRAVRVHEHLLSRGDLAPIDQDRAQYALALDFLKAGLLDRAEVTLKRLEGSSFANQARLALLGNYERSRDWTRAAEIAEQLEAANPGSFNTRLAHYLCEQAGAQVASGALEAAQQTLRLALKRAPQSARAYLELAQLLSSLEQSGQAYQLLFDALASAPQGRPLLAAPLAQLAIQTNQVKTALKRLTELYEQDPALDLLDAIVLLSSVDSSGSGDSRNWYVRHLDQQASLVAASKWLADEKLEHPQFHAQIQRALEHAVKPLLCYRCAACGFAASQHFWHCPGCQAWDSYPSRRIEEL